jgi:hypothetical protein
MIAGSRLVGKVTTGYTKRLIYYCLIGLGLSFYLHGFGVIWMLLIVLVNWVCCYAFCGKTGYPVAVWLANLGFLLLAEYYRGFKFGDILPGVSYLDTNHGEMKWNTVSNLRMLNIVSFCIDWHWARGGKATPKRS